MKVFEVFISVCQKNKINIYPSKYRNFSYLPNNVQTRLQNSAQACAN